MSDALDAAVGDPSITKEPDLTGESRHDRLFDAVMRRFEAMAPHRAGIDAVLHDTRRDPLVAVCAMGGFLRSMAATLEALGDAIADAAPLRRIGRPDDMAGVAIYLASRAGAYVTGAVIPVDGGIGTTV